MKMQREVAARKSGMSIWQSRKRRKQVAKAVALVLLIAGSILVLLPLVWMISTSLKDMSRVFVFPPEWMPDPIMWSNYVDVWRTVPFGIFVGNTAFITSIVIIGDLISASLVAFGFARLRAPGRDALFVLVLSTMMLPGYVTVIPVYWMFSKVGWIDTFYPLTVPSFFGGAFNIFLLRQFFLTIPRELDDAARIDGCSSFRIFAQIILPLSKPALTTIGILSFMWNWNDFFGPLIYLNSPENYTIALGLNFFRGVRSSQWNLLMAASFLALLPCIVLFFVAQKYFIQGIATTGIKG